MAYPRLISCAAAAALLALTGVSTSCITETEPGTRASKTLRTEGLIVSASLSDSWSVVQNVVTTMASGPADSAGVPNSLKAVIGGASTNVLVESKSPSQTAIHVRSDDPRVAERVRAAVQSRLSRR